MHKPQNKFDQVVKAIRSEDSTYDHEAYEFLRDALDFTVKELRSEEKSEHQHVCGPELLRGFRDYALKEFGSMAFAVLESWNVHRCEDVGAMVFQLIDSGLFGRSDTDSIDDFRSIFDFEEAFCAPYRPRVAYGERDQGRAALDAPEPRGSRPENKPVSSEQYEQPELS